MQQGFNQAKQPTNTSLTKAHIAPRRLSAVANSFHLMLSSRIGRRHGAFSVWTSQSKNSMETICRQGSDSRGNFVFKFLVVPSTSHASPFPSTLKIVSELLFHCICMHAIGCAPCLSDSLQYCLFRSLLRPTFLCCSGMIATLCKL